MKSGSTDAPGWLQWGETRTAADGLVERDFVLEVALASPEGEPETERVPGVLWSAAGASRPGTLVLGGHGFCVHKRVPFPLPVVRSLASEHGCAVAILDAPEHGDRRKDPAQDAQATADAWTAYWARYVGSRVAREYEAAAAALQALPEIADGPVGYWGLSLATQYGLGWLAETERCGAAVLGLFRKGPVVAYYAQR